MRETAECCRCLDEAKSLYAQEGRLSECAKLAKRRAEIFEKAEIIDLMLESYAEAAELFDGEDQKGETRNCKLKIAHYKALIEEKDAITEAIEIYEDVAKESLESNLLKWSVKQYYLKALLAALVLAANQLGKTVDDVREKAQQVGTPCHTATRALRALAVSVCLPLSPELAPSMSVCTALPRKTVSDLAQSIRSGRWNEQLSRLYDAGYQIYFFLII